MKKKSLLFDLLFTFMKIGLFTFGGGYAMISVIEDICVQKKKWISHDDMMNVTVVAESTPGPIAINCATYTGYRIAGFPGAVAATLGMVVPSLVIIYIISVFMEEFLALTFVANAFKGIRIAVGVIIVEAAVNMIRKMKKRPLSVAILVCGCTAMLAINAFSLSFSSIRLMILAAGVSVVAFALSGLRQGGAEK